MSEIYLSTDVEADGPIPGPHSMLSFGSAAYQRDKTLLGTFSANLQTLPGAQADPKTMAWWKTKPDAWRACRQDLEAPEVALNRYVAWLKTLPGKPVFVKTYAMAILRKGYRESVKKSMPKEWFDPIRHTHVALDDAIEQGALFCNMLAYRTDGAKNGV